MLRPAPDHAFVTLLVLLRTQGLFLFQLLRLRQFLAFCHFLSPHFQYRPCGRPFTTITEPEDKPRARTLQRLSAPIVILEYDSLYKASVSSPPSLPSLASWSLPFYFSKSAESALRPAPTTHKPPSKNRLANRRVVLTSSCRRQLLECDGQRLFLFDFLARRQFLSRLDRFRCICHFTPSKFCLRLSR